MSDLSAALGIRIRELRKAREMSQEELSFKASISAAHLGQIERGLKKTTVDTLGRIAWSLDITIQELFQFDAPVMPIESSSTLDKITAYLSTMTEAQRKDLLKVIKIFKNYCEPT